MKLPDGQDEDEIYLKVFRESPVVAGVAFRDVLDKLLHGNRVHVI